MGDVIFFQQTRKVAQSDRTAPPAQDATILFFTGVRYQRQPEPPAAPAEREAPPNGGMDGTGGRRRRRRG
jgi:hypothetical protein